MPKLSKPKSFSVSNETIQVDFQGTTCEVANLLKSGIINQTIILVAHADKWHEIEVSDLRVDDENFLENSHLPSFAHYVDVNKISLVDLGILSENVKTDYNLKHEDFMSLSIQFPEYDYIQISKLHDWEIATGRNWSIFEKRLTLKMLTRDKKTIENYIKENSLPEKNIKNMESNNETPIQELEITEENQLGIPVEKNEKLPEPEYSRSKQLYELGLLFEPRENSFNGFGFFVSLDSRIRDTEEDWDILIRKIIQEKSKNKTTPPVNAEFIKNENTTPAASAPAKKPISIQVFETLTPERISELQGLKEKQLEIVKKNPVIKKITDKTSYELAKKTKSVLLKASTAIDGKDGIEATATKYLNTFKNMLKNALLPIAKLTRDAYEEQSQIISAWENAEALRQQAEQRAKLEKIQKRTDELFAVPFTFNGTIYSIGTVYCTPSQVETATDEDFKVIVENGKAIKQALDAEATLQAGKDKEIADLKAQLAAFMALQNMSNTDAEQTEVKTETVEKTVNAAAAMPANNTVSKPVSTTQESPQPQAPAPVYNLPSPDNEPLNRLDLENAEHLEKPAYIKCRTFFIRGMKELTAEIEFILNDVTPNPIKKSERIQNLLEIIKKSE